MRSFWLFGLLTALGCASARPQKVSFTEAFGEAPAAPVQEAPAKKPSPKPLVAQQSLRLQSALLRFAAKARVAREGVTRRSPMPPSQHGNWEELLGSVDQFLERPAAGTSSFDLIRARITLEAELEMDAKSYDELPGPLADEVLQRVTRLGLRMAQVRSLKVKTRPLRTALGWPIEPVIVSSLFGKRLHPLSKTMRFHAGLDLVARAGQLISSAGRGVVVFSGWNGAHGKHVEVQHPGGVISRYSHLSQLLVEVGGEVGRGDPIGLAGSTGSSTGPHLHFELLRNGMPVDPLEELSQPPPQEQLAAF